MTESVYAPDTAQPMIGRRFERWIVCAAAEPDAKGQARWLCTCDCGIERVVRGYHLLGGKTRSCGCLRNEITATRNRSDAMRQKLGRPKIELSGKRYGRWLVISWAGESRWNCVCNCGCEAQVYGTLLRGGLSRSCGCLRLEIVREIAKSKRKTPEELRESERRRHAKYYQSPKFWETRRAYKESEAGKASLRKYYQSDKRKIADAKNRRSIKARRRAALAGKTILKTSEVAAVYAAWENQCAYCERSMPEKGKSIDHVVPVSCGGDDVLANVVPACLPCNKRKWALPLGEALKRMKIDPDAFWVRVNAAQQRLEVLLK